MEDKRKSNFGYVVTPLGDFVNIENIKDSHADNLSRTAQKLGLNFSFLDGVQSGYVRRDEYYIDSLVRNNYIVLLDMGQIDGEYLGLYVPENIEDVNDMQTEILSSDNVFDLINDYRVHLLYHVKQECKKFPYEDIADNQRHNKIFEILGIEKKVR